MASVGCDPNRIKQANKLGKNNSAKVCYSDGGGTFGRAGIRARENVGNGPKMRISQWRTPGFTLSASKEKSNPKEAKIDALVSWRVTLVPTSVESSFESLTLQVNGIDKSEITQAKKWRITNYDGEVFSYDIVPSGDTLVNTFSADAKGIIIPGLLGESFGGVNGGKFTAALIDGTENILLETQINAPKGWEFKKSARAAIEGLDELLKTPEKCGEME